MDIQAHEEGGRIIGGRYYFGHQKINQQGIIQLMMEPGEEMRYGGNDLHFVDFPGEYDIDGVLVRSWEAGGKLGYVIREENTFLALFCNKAVIDLAVFDNETHFFVTSQEIADELEKMEVAGTITDLSLPTTDQ